MEVHQPFHQNWEMNGMEERVLSFPYMEEMEVLDQKMQDLKDGPWKEIDFGRNDALTSWLSAKAPL